MRLSELWILWIFGLAVFFLVPAWAELPAPELGLTTIEKLDWREKQIMNEKSSDNLWCIGRFRFLLPAILGLSGRSQSIYGVEVRTVPIHSKTEAQTIWKDRVAHIQTLLPSLGTTSVIVRSFELQPGIPAVWYRKSQVYTSLRMLEAMMTEVDHVVFLAHDANAGGEAKIEKLLSNVANAYMPSLKRGFCVGQGSITSEPSIYEQALASFKHHHLPDFKLRFNTNVVSEPSKMYPLSEIDEFRAIYGPQGVQLKVLKDEARTVAGLPGRESITSLAQPGTETFIRYTWHFPGTSLRSDQPEILLDALARLADQKELQAVWDLLLQSMQRIPIQ